MLDIKFPDGSVKQFKNGITPFEIVALPIVITLEPVDSDIISVSMYVEGMSSGVGSRKGNEKS